jgi:NAD-dependent oxidoreductase involved in siderophore biosynthesis
LYNYRNDANPVNHRLILGRVTVSTRRLDELNIVSHHGSNIYGGAKFVHMSRIYFFGRTNKIFNGNTITDQPMNQGWINIFDPLEHAYSCNPTT